MSWFARSAHRFHGASIVFTFGLYRTAMLGSACSPKFVVDLLEAWLIGAYPNEACIIEIGSDPTLPADRSRLTLCQSCHPRRIASQGPAGISGKVSQF